MCVCVRVCVCVFQMSKFIGRNQMCACVCACVCVPHVQVHWMRNQMCLCACVCVCAYVPAVSEQHNSENLVRRCGCLRARNVTCVLCVT